MHTGPAAYLFLECHSLPHSGCLSGFYIPTLRFHLPPAWGCLHCTTAAACLLPGWRWVSCLPVPACLVSATIYRLPLGGTWTCRHCCCRHHSQVLDQNLPGYIWYHLDGHLRLLCLLPAPASPPPLLGCCLPRQGLPACRSGPPACLLVPACLRRFLDAGCLGACVPAAACLLPATASCVTYHLPAWEPLPALTPLRLRMRPLFHDNSATIYWDWDTCTCALPLHRLGGYSTCCLLPACLPGLGLGLPPACWRSATLAGASAWDVPPAASALCCLLYCTGSFHHLPAPAPYGLLHRWDILGPYTILLYCLYSPAAACLLLDYL